MSSTRHKPRYLCGDDPDDKAVNLSHDQRQALNTVCLAVFALCADIAQGETVTDALLGSAYRSACRALDVFPADTQVARRIHDNDIDKARFLARTDPVYRSVLEKFQAAKIPI